MTPQTADPDGRQAVSSEDFTRLINNSEVLFALRDINRDAPLIVNSYEGDPLRGSALPRRTRIHPRPGDDAFPYRPLSFAFRKTLSEEAFRQRLEAGEHYHLSTEGTARRIGSLVTPNLLEKIVGWEEEEAGKLTVELVSQNAYSDFYLEQPPIDIVYTPSE